ncbi:hypothetical protein HOF40_04360 [Candidatus Parcubacteria bacterium]|jgi:hypothetical protein|nr:hypothetical protein [Candidatus Parcubacteria bacterium]
MKKTILLSITLIFVLGLTGCGVDNYMENKVENEMEKSLGQNVEVDMDGGEIKIETEDGIMIEAGENVDLPSDFPEDVYVVEGTVKSVMKNPVGEGYSITIETDKNVEDVKNIYTEKLPEDGWVLNAQMNLGEMAVVSGTKETSSVSVSISIQDEMTFVVLTVMNEGV